MTHSLLVGKWKFRVRVMRYRSSFSCASFSHVALWWWDDIAQNALLCEEENGSWSRTCPQIPPSGRVCVMRHFLGSFIVCWNITFTLFLLSMVKAFC